MSPDNIKTQNININSFHISGVIPQLADDGSEEQHEEDRAGGPGPAGPDAGLWPRQEDLSQEGAPPPLLWWPRQDLLARQARRVWDQSVKFRLVDKTI